MTCLRCLKPCKYRKTTVCCIVVGLVIVAYCLWSRQKKYEARNDEIGKDYFGLFHIVTNFVPFDNKELRKSLRIDAEPPTDQQLAARMSEIFECLQRNLNHNKIAFVHVLVLHNETIPHAKVLKMRNSHKLIIHSNYKWPTMLDQLAYAYRHLQGKTVVICHQDNYIGEGWEKVNHTVLKRERLMYALTRHPSPSKCNGTINSFHCANGSQYVGSHDTFVFYVNETMDHQNLVEINVAPNVNGMENVLMWIFKTRFNYRILNPCKVLVVHHEHCISIREIGRKRINVGGKSAVVPFSDQLQ